MLKCLAPVLCLFLITPLIAEYLLGNVPMTWIILLPILSLLYGSGAVLIRELARRNGRGWPTMVTLALAYAVIEEAFATQSWFNPNFAGQRLLDYGYVESLGTSPSWIVFVLILHVAWSICAPIALTEVIFTKRRLEPWLGTKGICIVGALFTSSVLLLMVHFITKDRFVASPTQFVVSGSVAIVLIVAAFVLFLPQPSAAAAEENDRGRLRTADFQPAPQPWVLGSTAMIAGSAFYILQEFAPKVDISTISQAPGIDMLSLGSHVPAWLTATLSLSIAAGMLFFVGWAARRSGWSDHHRFALACGAVLVYCWWGFFVEADLYGTAALPGRVLLVAAALLFLRRTGLRLKTMKLEHRQPAKS
jgi:hypothetical protein